MISLMCGLATETQTQKTEWGLAEKRGWGQQRVKGAKYMGTEDDVALDGRNTMQYTDHVS